MKPSEHLLHCVTTVTEQELGVENINKRCNSFLLMLSLSSSSSFISNGSFAGGGGGGGEWHCWWQQKQ